MVDWPKPIEYNWRGDRLQLAHQHQSITLKPMGPHSSARCEAMILSIDEGAQEVTLHDTKRQLTITFDDWCWRQASPQASW